MCTLAFIIRTPDLGKLDKECGGAVEFDYRIRNSPESLCLEPLMSLLWFFDIKGMARRSLICAAIKDCESPQEAERLVYDARRPGPNSWIKSERKASDLAPDFNGSKAAREDLLAAKRHDNAAKGETIGENGCFIA